MNQGIKVVKIALLGLGTVGSGVYKLIEEKGEEFEKTARVRRFRLKKVLVHKSEKGKTGSERSVF